MKIAIVSASEILQTITMDVLEEYASGLSIRLDRRYYLSSFELMKDVKFAGGYDLYILDAKAQEMDALELAKQLRANGDDGAIVFINGKPERGWEAFRVRAEDYLIGALNKKDFIETIDRIVLAKSTYTESKQMSFKLREGKMLYDESKLTYIDKSARSCTYHFANGKSYDGPSVRGAFEEYIEKYRNIEGCYLVGKSLLINMNYIRIIDDEKVILSNGEEVHPPKSRIQALYEAWIEFSEQRNRNF